MDDYSMFSSNNHTNEPITATLAQSSTNLLSSLCFSNTNQASHYYSNFNQQNPYISDSFPHLIDNQTHNPYFSNSVGNRNIISHPAYGTPSWRNFSLSSNNSTNSVSESSSQLESNSFFTSQINSYNTGLTLFNKALIVIYRV